MELIIKPFSIAANARLAAYKSVSAVRKSFG